LHHLVTAGSAEEHRGGRDRADPEVDGDAHQEILGVPTWVAGRRRTVPLVDVAKDAHRSRRHGEGGAALDGLLGVHADRAHAIGHRFVGGAQAAVTRERHRLRHELVPFEDSVRRSSQRTNRDSERGAFA
jgi:hypothetical protein